MTGPKERPTHLADVLHHAIQARLRRITDYGNAKDELCVRLVRTVRQQLLVEFEDRSPASLEELNQIFQAWVEQVYHRRVHSETGQTPLERFLAAGAPKVPSERSLREAFRWSERRTVSRTGTVGMHGNSYEVDPELAGRRVDLIFDPLELTDVEVRLDGHRAGLAVALKIKRHVHPRAQAQPEPAAPTGVDYLSLIRQRRERELQKRIDYRHLPAVDGAANDENDDQELKG